MELMINENDKITVKAAYAAMYKFLEHEYELTNSNDIAGLLGGMSLLENGNTADPAIWVDWLNAIAKASCNDCDISLQIIPEIR
jgi:hypothetical protein